MSICLGDFPVGPDSATGGIVQGDARELCAGIPDASVDLIFTDPPYLREFLHLYGWLGELAARVLKPDGFLLVYAGIYHKQEIMHSLGEYLEYFWDLVSFGATGPAPLDWRRMIISKYKSILCYRRTGSRAVPRYPVLSVWVGSGRDKRYHVWGQDESTARYYIDCFSKVRDVVLDPFCGGGTTPYVCGVMGRQWLAFDCDPIAVQTSRARVQSLQPLLFDLPMQQRMEMECAH